MTAEEHKRWEDYYDQVAAPADFYREILKRIDAEELLATEERE